MVIYDDKKYFWKILTLIQMKQTTLREGNAESNSADELSWKSFERIDSTSAYSGI